jgi:hypothetical protein
MFAICFSHIINRYEVVQFFNYLSFKVHIQTGRAIRQRDANFQFSMTLNFNIFLCFSNIRNHLSNFNYLVCISCKICNRSQFYLFLKTENSRRVAESRSVGVGLKGGLLHFFKIKDFLIWIWISGELLFVLKQRVSDWYNTTWLRSSEF